MMTGQPPSADDVTNRDSFVEFVGVLRDRVAHHPEDFENTPTDRFLDAAAAWTADLDGYFANRGLPPSRAGGSLPKSSKRH